MSGIMSTSSNIIPVPVTRGLYVWYDPGSPLSYTSGSTIFDLSSNKVNGVVTGSPSTTGGYFTLNGSSQWFFSGDISAAKGTSNSHTVEVWILQTVGATSIWSDRSNQSTDTSSGPYRTSGAESWWDGSNYISATELFSSGSVLTRRQVTTSIYNWIQLVRVYTGASFVTYLNGTTTSGALAVTWNSPNPWYIGFGSNIDANFAFSNSAFRGSYGTVRVYNRALSQAEVIQNYNATKIRYTQTYATPVLWYDPIITRSYSGSGTTVNSIGSSAISGTLSNVTFTSPSFSFNGTNSQITILDNAALEPGSGDWTMEVWFNPTVIQNSVILGKFDPGGGSTDVSYSIRMNSGGSVWSQIGSGSGYVDSTFYQTAINTWYQIVYVFKNGATKTLETFVNGTSIGTVNHTLPSILNTTANLYLGSYNGGEFSQWFNGRIGITRLYNSALTSTEVLLNYDTDKSRYGL